MGPDEHDRYDVMCICYNAKALDMKAGKLTGSEKAHEAVASYCQTVAGQIDFLRRAGYDVIDGRIVASKRADSR